MPKKNAIYGIHIEYGSKPAATRMDYLAEFSVTMPILSLTATSENVVDGEGPVQVYCVQTQAIQQYALDLSQCLPPLVESIAPEKDASASRIFEISASSAFTPVEPSHGNNVGQAITGDSRAKSPGPVNAAEKTPTSRSPAFVSTVESSDMHDPMAMSGVDARYGVSISPGILTDNAPLSSQVPVPLSPRLSGRQLRPKSPSRNFEQALAAVTSAGDQEYLLERKLDSVLTTLPDMASLEAIGNGRKVDECLKKDDEKIGQSHLCAAMNPSIAIECQVSSSPTHLVTPSQLMCMAVPSENMAITNETNKRDNTEVKNMKLETKVEPITSLSQQQESCSKKEVENASTLTDTVDKTFNSQASEQSSENARESVTLSTESLNVEEIQIAEEVIDEREQLSSVCTEHVQENQKDTIGKVPESALILATSQSPSLGKGKEIKKTGSESVPSSSSGSSFLSISSDGQPSSNTSVPSAEAISAQVLAMQEALNQLITMQKELQKQMSVMVAVPVAKEGKRMEAALGQRLEKVVKAHVDAMWARLQEENAKREKADRERVQQLTSLLNSINKDLPTTLERVLKKEIGSLGPTVARIVTPTLEKTISTAINDSFQKGVSDKALAQLEKSVVTKLDSLVSRQIQTQFQSSGKQVLQDTLRSSFENSIIPAFERSCKAMFDQVDSAFQKGMAEHTTAAQQQFATTHTVLASTLQDAVASASSLAQSLKGELADGQRRLLALAEGAGASSARLPTFNTKQGNSGLGGLPDKKAISLKHLEESLDPTKELSRLVSERKFEEAFHKALQMSDVSIVSWLCTQADPQSLFSMVPLPLSQGVLLSLVQQLSCDLGKDTARKLVWIREAALALNPNDPILAHHMRPILGDLYQNLHGQMLITSSGGEASSIRLVLHLVNSILTACK